jgi:hypothetical protein
MSESVDARNDRLMANLQILEQFASWQYIEIGVRQNEASAIQAFPSHRLRELAREAR